MKIKVLPLDWPKSDRRKRHILETLNEYSEETEPIFNREGRYYDRESGKCWVEFDGRAWLLEVSQFKHDLSLFEYKNNPLPDKCVEAIDILLNHGIKNKELIELLNGDRRRRAVKAISRNTKLWYKHFKNKKART